MANLLALEAAPDRTHERDELGNTRTTGRRAAQSPWVERLARIGLVAKGVPYALVAILAVNVALGGREESPDRHGALRAIAEQPFGKWLLTLIAIGLAGYALWRLTQAILDRDYEGGDAKRVAKRGGSLAKAIWYGARVGVRL